MGLSLKPLEGSAFYSTIAIATLLGIAINFTKLDPIKALYYSAVINGLAAVPVIAIMMLIASDKKVMGGFVIKGWLKYLGWATAIVMAIAAALMVAQSL